MKYFYITEVKKVKDKTIIIINIPITGTYKLIKDTKSKTILRDLVEKKIIVSEGANRNKKYIIIKAKDWFLMWKKVENILILI